MNQAAAEILFVEDNSSDAELAVYALHKQKLDDRVAIVRDGAEALDYVFGKGDDGRSLLPDLPRLVLLDLKLPKVDGIDVLRRIKSDPRTQGLPVVMLTSSREERDIMESYRLGVNSYVVKPLDSELYMKAVQGIGSYWLSLNERTPPVPAGGP